MILYARPYFRFGSYGVGALIGIFYFEFKNEEKFSFGRNLPTKFFKLLQTSDIVGWISILLGIAVIIYLSFAPVGFYAFGEYSWP